MIQVLIVDDSPVVQELLVHILTSEPEIQVMGRASNGAEALEFLQRHKPDVITMDIQMPRMDGFEATRRIMETQPVPIVVVSASWQAEEVALTFRIMEAGAVAVVEKPRGVLHPDYESLAMKLIHTVKAMSEVKVVRRWARLREEGREPRSVERLSPSPASPSALSPRPLKVVAIGASTGGPPVLQTILAGLPRDFPVPILIVQHISAGFLPGLVDWLGQATNFPIHIAAQGETLLPGQAYLAPDGVHMGVDRGGRIALSPEPPENSVRPAVSYLFRSVAQCFGATAAGVLLTGMGRDGAEELKLLKEKGAVTIAQDKESSIVHGMPGEAIKLDAATYVLAPERIAAMLESLARIRKI